MLKFNRIYIILLFVFILSISAVCAQDANQTDEPTGSVDEIVLADSNSTAKTFADLEKDISSGENEFNVTSDYKFDSQYDKNYTKGIKITGKSLVINGNGHTIDSDSKAIVFQIKNSTIVINNLVFKNSNESALYVQKSNLTTNNCIFENNVASQGAAVYTEGTNYTSSNDKFTGNYAKQGSSLYISENSNLKLDNASFASNRELYWGLIYVMKSQMAIVNTNFDNITSKYAPAIYAKESRGQIKNCNFTNLAASVTAGAIGFKQFSQPIEIDNCNFINVSSRKNAGALFVDTLADEMVMKGTVLINNSQFINCLSEFGGAIVYLAGSLTVDNSNFTSNNAIYDGGAIYSSHVRVNILNSNFISNHALTDGYSNGGAFYFDMGTLTLNSTRFENNTAGEADSIYAYDATLNLNNNYFNNPSSKGSSIYAVFLKKITEKGNNYNDDSRSLANKNFETNVEGSQMSFKILENTIHFDTLPSRFDLRDYNFTSPVYDQGLMGSCWAYGAVEALQSSLLRYANVSYNFSVNNLQNSLLEYSKYGIIEITEGGSDLYMPATYLISWLGISPAEYDGYDELGKISPLIFTDEDIHIMDFVQIPKRKNVTDNNAIKEAILKYGGVEASYYSELGFLYYNETSHAYYYLGKNGPSHSICIVGWDDNYSRNNFVFRPQGDGAFIVQNSWGTEWGENGFFYVSYYDQTFATYYDPVAYVIKNNVTYDMNYQHEISGLMGVYDLGLYKNKYVAEKDGLISAVGTFFNKTGLKYEFYINVNDVNVYSHKGVSEFRGYSTIQLDKSVQIKKGDKFEVIFFNNVPYMSASRLHGEANVSFMGDGEEWVDLFDQDAVALLKVYTVEDLGITSNIVKYYGDKTPFTANVGAGVKVTFDVNGAKYERTGDENGTATLPISNWSPGDYKITVTFNNTSIIAAVVVKDTIIASNVKRAAYSNYNYKIKLLDSKGALLKNTNVKVAINGKTSTYKTDSSGYITIKFTKLNSKKTITITNPKTGQVSKKTITVMSRFGGTKNVKMYYFDGTKYTFMVMGNDLKTPLKNKYVSIKIDKKTYKVKTNSKGIVSFKIPKTVTPGTHKITVKYGGESETHKLTVKQVIKAKKTVTVKRSSKLVYKVTLKGKKVIKNKKVTLKLNGKKYTAKTNKKGVAKFTVKKSAIKKLKAGKKYTMKVIYLKDTLKRTLKVKR